MVVASHNLSAGRPCERRDPSPLAPKVKKGFCSSAEARVRAAAMSAIALTLGSLRSQGRLIENSICDSLGLDPGIHAAKWMDCRIRSGNDDLTARSKTGRGSLRRKLAHRAQPILDMVGANHLAALERVNVNRHQFERLAAVRRAHEFTCWRAGGFAAYGNLVARDQDLLDFPFQVRNGFEPLSDPGDDF